MNKTEIAVAVLLVIMVAAVMYIQRPPEEPETLPQAQAPEESLAPPMAAEPEIRYPVEPAPVPQTEAPVEVPAGQPDSAGKTVAATDTGADSVPGAEPAAEPLPTLEESDAALKGELEPVVDMSGVAGLFYTDRLIRRFVVTVDNLPNRQYPRSNYRTARSIPGQLVVRRVRIYEGDEEKLYLNRDNYARYTPFVKLVTGLKSQRLVMIYRHFYPLFQTAYEDLGYPSAYFNDRLVDVIDHLLEAPEVAGEIRLVRPHVLYQYADPELEALSAGQKLFIRVGPVHAAALKDKLREIRLLLTGTPVHEPAGTSENAPSTAVESPKM